MRSNVKAIWPFFAAGGAGVNNKAVGCRPPVPPIRFVSQESVKDLRVFAAESRC